MHPHLSARWPYRVLRIRWALPNASQRKQLGRTTRGNSGPRASIVAAPKIRAPKSRSRSGGVRGRVGFTFPNLARTRLEPQRGRRRNHRRWSMAARPGGARRDRLRRPGADSDRRGARGASQPPLLRAGIPWKWRRVAGGVAGIPGKLKKLRMKN